MKKNKKFTYVLLSCVALIWSIIFYKVYIAIVQEDELISMPATSKASYVKLINHENDSVKLVLNYRNPFANYKENASPIVAAIPVNPTSIKIAADQKIKPKVNWNSILYSGYINNPANKQKVGIISMNGTSFMIAEGQTINGLKLLKLMRDSAQLRYQKETKYIKLK